MAAPTIYRSTDASAPTMTGQAGKLVALLDACLVNGYGSKAAAGWSKAYTDTNYGAYRPGAGNQHYLRVDDSAAQMARVLGYQTMSSLLVGTNPFPTDAQISGGMYVRKSIAASSTTRPWILLATNRTFYLIIFGGVTTFGSYDGGDSHLAFGELTSYLTNDTTHSFICAGTDTSTSSTTATLTRQALASYGSTAVRYIAADYTGTGGAKVMNVRAPNIYQQTHSGATAAPYPESVSGGLHIDKMIAYESNLSMRGEMPGIWGLGHSYTSFANMDTFDGTSSTISGWDFLIVLSGSYGIVFRTDDW